MRQIPTAAHLKASVTAVKDQLVFNYTEELGVTTTGIIGHIH